MAVILGRSLRRVYVCLACLACCVFSYSVLLAVVALCIMNVFRKVFRIRLLCEVLCYTQYHILVGLASSFPHDMLGDMLYSSLVT